MKKSTSITKWTRQATTIGLACFVLVTTGHTNKTACQWNCTWKSGQCTVNYYDQLFCSHENMVHARHACNNHTSKDLCK